MLIGITLSDVIKCRKNLDKNRESQVETGIIILGGLRKIVRG